MARTPFILLVFGVISVLLTMLAALLAMHRPDVERLHVETRSRLQADYSVDSVARRIEPLAPEIVRAAAEDEAQLTREQPPAAEVRRVAPAGVTPVSTAMPTSTPAPSPTVRGTSTASATPPPGSTARPPTPGPGTPSPTDVPAATPRPEETPEPTVPAVPTIPIPTLPVPTIPVPTLPVPTVPLPTLVPPTKTPTPTSTPTAVPPTAVPTPTLTPTPVPTTIVGGILNSLSCVLGSVLSLPGGQQTSITFLNLSGQTVRVYQLPVLILGAPQSIGTIQPGDDLSRSTYVGQAFRVEDTGGRCLGVYRAQAGGGTAIID